MVKLRKLFISFLLLLMAALAGAQVHDDVGIQALPDSIRNDYEEWLRNEPPRPAPHDSTALRPLPPRIDMPEPRELGPKKPSVSVVIMTPKLRTDMQLAYQSHWLEEQRKAQVGGAMTIGVNPLSLIAWAVKKIFPRRKSKKQRQREKLKQIIDNY